MMKPEEAAALLTLQSGLEKWAEQNPDAMAVEIEERAGVSVSCDIEALMLLPNEAKAQIPVGDPRRVWMFEEYRRRARSKGGIHELFGHVGADIAFGLDTGTWMRASEIAQYNEGAQEPSVESVSAGVNAGIRVERNDGDYSVHRPPSETSGRMFDPLGNDRSIEREQKEKTKGKVRYVEGKENAPDQFDDIPLITTFGQEDLLTGLMPFEDNGAPLKKVIKRPYKFTSDGETRPMSDRAVDAQGTQQGMRSTSNDNVWRTDERIYLLKNVLPRLTNAQSIQLAKAFMAHDDRGVEEILELVYKTLPYMTYKRYA